MYLSETNLANPERNPSVEGLTLQKTQATFVGAL